MLPLQSKKVTIHKSHRKSLSLLDQTQATLTLAAMRMKYMSIPFTGEFLTNSCIYSLTSGFVSTWWALHIVSAVYSYSVTIFLCPPGLQSKWMEGRTAQTEAGNGSDNADEMGMGRPQFHLSVDCALRAGLSLFVFLWNVFSLSCPQEGTTKIGRIDSDEEQDIGR